MGNEIEEILVQEGRNCQIRWIESVGEDEKQALIEEGFMAALIHIAKRTGIDDIEDRILDNLEKSGEQE